MANQVILKKSSVAARVPVAGDLAYGELALNYADGVLYFKKPDNSISSISGSTTGVLTIGTGLSGTSFNGSAAVTIAIDSSVATLTGTQTLSNKTFAAPVLGTPASGNFSTGTFTWPTFNQNTTGSAATLTTSRNINGVAFNGSADITVADSTKLPLAGGSISGKLTVSAGTNISNGIAFPTNAFGGSGDYATITLEAASGTEDQRITFRVANDAADGIDFFVPGYNNVWINNKIVLNEGNYNTYAPTLGGTGASGTWSINVNGSAATLAIGHTIAMTGDVTWTSASFNGSADVTGTATLASTTVTAGSYTLASITVDAKGRITAASSGSAGGSGTVTTLSIATANGFAGTVATATTTPIITLTTSITGLLKGNGTAISAATAGTDYIAPYGSTTANYILAAPSGAAGVPTFRAFTATDIPSLDAAKITSGIIDAARLPSYVDDVIEGANLAAFPGTGETGKIYVALDTNKTYRWSGSAYVYITSGAVDSVAGKTGVVTLDTLTIGTGFSGISYNGSAAVTIALASAYGDTTNPYASKTANYILAAPSSAAGVPTFRALVANDIPTLNQNTTGSAATLTTGHTIAMTGDVTWTSASFNGSADVTGTATLASTTVTAGSYTNTNITVDAKGRITAASSGSASGSGTVTTLSVATANGFAGTVATASTTPVITLTTSVTGLLKGNGTAISAATAGTDYSAGTSALTTGILKSTTLTGALTIAVAADFPTLNQNTSGTAAGLSATLSAASGGTGVANNAASTLTISGAFGTTFTVSAITALTLPTTGTLATTTQAFYLGTTNIAINRASGAIALSGITSIDGSAASATKATNLTGGNATTLLGSIGYQSNTDITTLLAPNITTTKKFLTQTGSGTNGAAPAWGTLAAADIPTLNQNTTGSAAFVTATAATGSAADLVLGQMAGTDNFRIRVGDAGNNNGWVEFATADDANEVFYFRQYNYLFGSVSRELTLLDGSGNTILPGTLTVGSTLTVTGASGTINGSTIIHAGNLSSYTATNATTATKVAGSTAGGTATADIVTGTMAGNDYFRIRIGGTANDTGWAEIATADNGNEPIYVRQYTTGSLPGFDYSSVTTELILLDASGNTTIPGNLTVSGNITVTGTANTLVASKVAGATTGGTATADLVTGTMADNDYFRIRIGGTAADTGWAEIATADGGNEPIYVRQYTGTFSFNSIARTLTLLDASGNTSLPGSLTVGTTLTVTGASGTINGSTIIHAGNVSSYTAGKATILETTRAIYGNNFDGSAALTQIIASTYGGTGSGFTKFSGPTTAERTFTLPDASATILTTNALVTGTQGGTGVNNGTKTITLGGNLTTSGAFNTTLTVTADTSVTLPTTGTLVNTAVTSLSSLTSIGATLTGLLKATSGALSAASAGTDYIAPYGSTTANYVLAAPNGSAGTPSFRQLVAADLAAPSDNTYLKYTTAGGLAWATVTGSGGNAIQVLDEGTSLTSTLSSINFTGSGVTATNTSGAVTVTITGTGGGASVINDLTDVTITGTPTNGSTLKYDTTTSQWINSAPTSMVTRTYTGTGAQTGFTVTAGLTVDSVIVTENGIVQVPGTDYTIASTTLTFTTAPASGTIIQIRELTAVTTVQTTGTTIGKTLAMAMIFGG